LIKVKSKKWLEFFIDQKHFDSSIYNVILSCNSKKIWAYCGDDS